MLDYSLTVNGPVAIRYPKGNTVVDNKWARQPMKGLDWETIMEGSDCCIFSFGRMLNTALESAQLLRKEGIRSQVVNARVIKPLDGSKLTNITFHTNKWITLEDNVVQGGFGSSINEFVSAHNYPVSLLNLGIQDDFVAHGSVDHLMRQLHLDPQSVASQIKIFLNDYRKRFYVNY